MFSSCSSPSQANDTTLLSSCSLCSFHNSEDSKRGETGTSVLSLSAIRGQRQANSHRLIWVSSFVKNTTAQSDPIYPMGWPKGCHQLEAGKACWSCSTAGADALPFCPSLWDVSKLCIFHAILLFTSRVIQVPARLGARSLAMNKTKKERGKDQDF